METGEDLRHTCRTYINDSGGTHLGQVALIFLLCNCLTLVNPNLQTEFIIHINKADEWNDCQNHISLQKSLLQHEFDGLKKKLQYAIHSARSGEYTNERCIPSNSWKSWRGIKFKKKWLDHIAKGAVTVLSTRGAGTRREVKFLT